MWKPRARIQATHPHAHCPGPVSLGFIMGVGRGKSLHTQARDNCASDVWPLVSFKKESSTGLGASGARASTARIMHGWISAAAHCRSLGALAATIQKATWELSATPHSHPPFFLLPSTPSIPLSHLSIPQKLQGRACKRGSM